MASFGEIHQWTGIPENTIRGWFAGEGNPTAEFLLALLERVPEDAQMHLLVEFRRLYPTLADARLAGDRTVVSRLMTLLGQSRGFTYIEGGSEEERTFLITALSHSFSMLRWPSDRVLGMDVHACDWFVPVSGVVYLHNLLQRDELLRAAQTAWPSLRTGETPLVMFNGLWSILPEFQEKIRELSGHCHVLVADQASIGVPQPVVRLRLPNKATVITICAAPLSSSMRIEIRAP